MSTHAELFTVAARHQPALLALLRDLERAGRPHPREAEALHQAVWPFLQAYGRRDATGAVDDPPPLQPWRPEDGLVD